MITAPRSIRRDPLQSGMGCFSSSPMKLKHVTLSRHHPSTKGLVGSIALHRGLTIPDTPLPYHDTSSMAPASDRLLSQLCRWNTISLPQSRTEIVSGESPRSTAMPYLFVRASESSLCVVADQLSRQGSLL